MVHPLAAGKSRPFVVVRIQQHWTAHFVTLLGHHFQRRARRSLDRDARPANPTAPAVQRSGSCHARGRVPPATLFLLQIGPLAPLRPH